MQNLFLHQVAAVNLFGDRVLHLDARVHLDEVIMPVVIDQELHRAGVLITDRLRQLDRGVAHFLAQPAVMKRRRTFLDHLLVAPLDRAIALAQVNGVAVLVGHDLKFDVMRIDDQFLDVNVAVAESLLRFRARGVKAGHEAGLVMRGAHAAAAAAGDRFDHDRDSRLSSRP